MRRLPFIQSMVLALLVSTALSTKAVRGLLGRNLWTIVLVFLFAVVSSARAKQFGLLTYRVSGEEITITDYPEDAVGDVDIPDVIDGKTVPTIAYAAFSGCRGLTSVTIPNSVTTIDRWAFSDCRSLTSIAVAPGNAQYASEEGVLFNADKSVLIRCPQAKMGSYSIPQGVAEIAHLKWSRAGTKGDAFTGCAGLTSIHVSDSVADIGYPLFSGCESLSTINVAPANPHYSSSDRVLYNDAGDTLLRCPEGRSGALSIPEGVRSISGSFYSLVSGGISVDSDAFKNCNKLTSITFPQSISSDPVNAPFGSVFRGCTRLERAIFLGDAPGLVHEASKMQVSAFGHVAPGFTAYYMSGSEGFTSPRWDGVTRIAIDEVAHPAALWALRHDLPYDIDLSSEPDLLMAYALNLDPNQNLRKLLPVPVFADGSLSISFHAASRGITYTVETSTDLRDWTTDGVMLSKSDTNDRMRASISPNTPNRFLRLVATAE